jgi:hypothetical protein
VALLYSVEAAASIEAEFAAAGPRIITEKVPVHYNVFFDAMPAAHLAFFTSLKTCYETDDVVCVHAGVDPAGGPLHLQDREGLIWGTDRFPDD